MQELVDGTDVVNDDLISRIDVAFAMEVVSAVQEPSGVMSEVFCMYVCIDVCMYVCMYVM